MPEREPKRIVPGICVRDNTKITDDPPFNNGYVSDKPTVLPSGEVIPAVERCLCKAHYLEEHAEVNNGRNPFAGGEKLALAEVQAAQVIATAKAEVMAEKATVAAAKNGG